MANESTVIVKYKVDKSAVQTTETAGKRLIKQQQALGKAAETVTKAATKATKTLGDVDSRQVGKVADEWDDVAKSITRATSAQRDYNEAFDKTSRDVALAGDVESNLRAVGGAAGAAGLGGVGTGIGAAAELPALVEALPKLKTSLAGLPSTVKAAASEIGVGGFGLMGALAGLGIAFKVLGDQAASAEQQLTQELTARQEYNQFIATASQEEIAQRRAANEEIIAANQLTIAQTQADMEDLAQTLTGSKANEFLRGIGISLGETAGEMNAYEKTLADLETQTGILIEENEKLEGSMSSLAGTTEASAQSVEESSQAAEEAARAQEESARTQEAAAQKAAQAAEQAAQRIQQAHQQYSDAVDNINRQTSQSIADANRKSKQSLKDLKKTLAQDLGDAVIEANRERIELLRNAFRDEQKEMRSNQRELKNIRKEAIRSEQDAIHNRDFLALAELAKTTKEQVDDAKEGFLNERKEREIAAKFAMGDLKETQSIQRMERLRDFQRQRQDLRKNLKRQMADINRGASRQLENAARARDKQLQIAQQGAAGLLQIEQKLWSQRNRMAGGRMGGRGGRRGQRFGSLIGGDPIGMMGQIGLF